MTVDWVVYIEKHLLLCGFSDGCQRLVDLKNVTEWQDHRAQALLVPHFFSRAVAFRGRLLWPNFFSLCPNFLRSCSLNS
jgi:hypothetical protein